MLTDAAWLVCPLILLCTSIGTHAGVGIWSNAVSSMKVQSGSWKILARLLASIQLCTSSGNKVFPIPTTSDNENSTPFGPHLRVPLACHLQCYADLGLRHSRLSHSTTALILQLLVDMRTCLCIQGPPDLYFHSHPSLPYQLLACDG